MSRTISSAARSGTPASGYASPKWKPTGTPATPRTTPGWGKVGAALALDTSLSGTPLGEPIAVYPRAAPPGRVLVGPRVGIDYAEPGDREAPWRVAVSNSRWVSHRKGLRPHP
jgi:DNA-3-methyladenine glycosylase